MDGLTLKGKKVPKRPQINVLYLKELEAYRLALTQALEDGIITEDEEAILAALRDDLEISDEAHSAILDMVKMKTSTSGREIDTYTSALSQALEDGLVTDDEQAILEALRDALNISDEEHDDILKRLQKGK